MSSNNNNNDMVDLTTRMDNFKIDEDVSNQSDETIWSDLINKFISKNFGNHDDIYNIKKGKKKKDKIFLSNNFLWDAYNQCFKQRKMDLNQCIESLVKYFDKSANKDRLYLDIRKEHLIAGNDKFANHLLRMIENDNNYNKNNEKVLTEKFLDAFWDDIMKKYEESKNIEWLQYFYYFDAYKKEYCEKNKNDEVSNEDVVKYMNEFGIKQRIIYAFHKDQIYKRRVNLFRFDFKRYVYYYGILSKKFKTKVKYSSGYVNYGNAFNVLDDGRNQARHTILQTINESCPTLPHELYKYFNFNEFLTSRNEGILVASDQYNNVKVLNNEIFEKLFKNSNTRKIIATISPSKRQRKDLTEDNSNKNQLLLRKDFVNAISNNVRSRFLEFKLKIVTRLIEKKSIFANSFNNPKYKSGSRIVCLSEYFKNGSIDSYINFLKFMEDIYNRHENINLIYDDEKIDDILQLLNQNYEGYIQETLQNSDSNLKKEVKIIIEVFQKSKTETSKWFSFDDFKVFTQEPYNECIFDLQIKKLLFDELFNSNEKRVVIDDKFYESHLEPLARQCWVKEKDNSQYLRNKTSKIIKALKHVFSRYTTLNNDCSIFNFEICDEITTVEEEETALNYKVFAYFAEKAQTHIKPEIEKSFDSLDQAKEYFYSLKISRNGKGGYDYAELSRFIGDEPVDNIADIEVFSDDFLYWTQKQHDEDNNNGDADEKEVKEDNGDADEKEVKEDNDDDGLDWSNYSYTVSDDDDDELIKYEMHPKKVNSLYKCKTYSYKLSTNKTIEVSRTIYYSGGYIEVTLTQYRANTLQKQDIVDSTKDFLTIENDTLENVCQTFYEIKNFMSLQIDDMCEIKSLFKLDELNIPVIAGSFKVENDEMEYDIDFESGWELLHTTYGVEGPVELQEIEE